MFLLKLSSISQHCSAIQLSFALLISCLIFLLTFLYFAAPSGSHFLLFNSLLLSQRFRMSAVKHGFFVRRCFPRISLAVSITILLKVLWIMEALEILISVNTHGNWCIRQVYPIQTDVGCFIPWRQEVMTRWIPRWQDVCLKIGGIGGWWQPLIVVYLQSDNILQYLVNHIWSVVYFFWGRS